tara:strand:+ start:903 stop:1226 length:324 start_codon:yes stop_codon:yes gene_type:complete
MPASEEYQAEVEQRINRVARLISNGGRRSDVLQMCAEKWGLKDRQADLYLERAREKVKADYDMDRPQMLADLLSQLSTIQMEARRSGNLNIALGAINTAAKLTQLLS